MAEQAHDAGWKFLHDLDAKNKGIDSSGLTGISAAAAQFPAFAPMMNIPEVAALLNQASVEGWSSDQFALHLMATNWWKSKSDTERVWEATKLSDPAKAAQLKAQKIAEVTAEAGKLGVAFDANQIQFVAEGAIGGGWNATQLQAAIAGNAQFNKDQPGQIAATQTALNGIARDYGVPVSDHTSFDWAKKIAVGNADQTAFGEYVKQQAKITHPYWEAQLDQGLTVRQLADPYLQTAGKLLETDPNQIDLSDHKWANAFTQADDKHMRQPMSQSAWATKLMTDQTYGWDRTNNARDAALQIQKSLRESFGAV